MNMQVKRLERFYSLCQSRDSKLTPCTTNSDRSPRETKALWQSVDYSSLATPSRPGSPSRVVVGNEMEALWPSSLDFLDLTDFVGFGQGLDAMGQSPFLNGDAALDACSNSALDRML